MATNKGGNWVQVQRDFSGGEVGIRVAMRDDSEFFAKSVITMENYVPTLQGTAVRVPGTRFIAEAGADTVRLFPYMDPTNRHILVEMQAGSLRIISGVGEAASYSVSTVAAPFSLNAPTPVIFQIAVNPVLESGLDGWALQPNSYNSNGDDQQLGCWLEGVGVDPNIVMVSRDWKHAFDRKEARVLGTAIVPETSDGEWLKVRVSLQYAHNYSGPNAEYQMFMRLGTFPNGNDIWEEQFTGQPGAVRQFVDTIDLTLPGTPDLTPGQVIHTSFYLIAVKDPSLGPSTPFFRVFGFEVFAKGTMEVTDEVVGLLPYAAEDLDAVQYVQSPYINTSEPESTGKELVFVHPKYRPQELVQIAGVYTIREKAFNDIPIEWTDDNYPAACTSFNGRLLLGGSQKDPILSDPTGSAIETVWGTEVGDWFTLITPDDPEDPGVNADDSIQFTTIYRSPIEWLYGQRNLLVGAREMEYIASADGIFSPGDIGVTMQSTHGSVPVQPVGMGPHVLYAAEGGTRVRAMQFVAQDDGWTSPDMTLLHPQLFQAGIVRMVRMRNPHQIVVVVMKSGQLALFHEDSYAGLHGWSRVNFNAQVRDACVITTIDGTDMLVLTVERVVNGAKVLYLETIAEWITGVPQQYVQSATLAIPDTPTSVITGLEHLENELVQVLADSAYLGTHQVIGGQISLIDDSGEPIIFTGAVVGLQMTCTLTTLPLVGTDPDAQKRYSKLTVRCLNSSRPLVNGERTADRNPSRPQNLSQGLDLYYDNSVAKMGSDKLQIITIQETLPIRSEIVGIFGSVTGNSV